jgi:hypothetical protein
MREFAFPELFKLGACVFSETVLSECFLMDIVYNRESRWNNYYMDKYDIITAATFRWNFDGIYANILIKLH